MLSKVVTPESWFRAISFKTLQELKPRDFSLKLPILKHKHWLEAPRGLRPEALGLRPTESTSDLAGGPN